MKAFMVSHTKQYTSLSLSILSAVSFFILMAFPALGHAQATGESLYKTNCAACHTITSKKLVGPGMEGISQKRSREWLYKWIQNSQELIASGDKDAIAVFEEYNKVVMPAQALTNEEIDLILEYIENPPASATAANAASSSEENIAPKQTPIGLVLGGLVVMLFIIVMLNQVYKSLYQIASNKK